MLVDLPTWFQGPNCPSTQAIQRAKEQFGDEFDFEFPTPIRLEKGVYETQLNFNHDLDMAEIKIDDRPFSPWMDFAKYPDADDRLRMLDEAEGHPHDYGVCDNFQQILDRWPEIVSSERNLLIYLTRMTRAETPAWRWHKWGEYIGSQTPTQEHIGDEPKISEVFVFYIVELVAIPTLQVNA